MPAHLSCEPLLLRAHPWKHHSAPVKTFALSPLSHGLKASWRFPVYFPTFPASVIPVGSQHPLSFSTIRLSRHRLYRHNFSLFGTNTPLFATSSRSKCSSCASILYVTAFVRSTIFYCGSTMPFSSLHHATMVTLLLSVALMRLILL